MILRAVGQGVVWGSVGGALYMILAGTGLGVVEGEGAAGAVFGAAFSFIGGVGGGIIGLVVGVAVGGTLQLVFGSPDQLRLHPAMARPARLFGTLAAIGVGGMAALAAALAGLRDPAGWALLVVGPSAVAAYFAYRKSPEIIGLPTVRRKAQRIWWTSRGPARA